MQNDLKKYWRTIQTFIERMRSGRRGGYDPVRDWHTALSGAAVISLALCGVGAYLFFAVQENHLTKDGSAQNETRMVFNRDVLTATVEGFKKRTETFSSLRATLPAIPNPGTATQPPDASETIDAMSTEDELDEDASVVL